MGFVNVYRPAQSQMSLVKSGFGADVDGLFRSESQLIRWSAFWPKRSIFLLGVAHHQLFGHGLHLDVAI